MTAKRHYQSGGGEASGVFVTVNQVRLHVVDEGSGPTVLLVHGFPLDQRMWRDQIERLETSYRVLAPDLRGFGTSQAVAGTTTMSQFAADLDQMLDAVGVSEPVTLCGLSMGGYIAFAFVEQFPDRVERLVLCDTRAAGDTAEAASARLEVAARVEAEGVEVLLSAMLGRLLSEQTRRERPEVIGAIDAMIRASSPTGAAAALRGMAERPDVRGKLGSIKIPTLVIVGREDVISPPAEMRQIADALNAAYVEIGGAGHMTPMENPQAFHDALIPFLT